MKTSGYDLNVLYIYIYTNAYFYHDCDLTQKRSFVVTMHPVAAAHQSQTAGYNTDNSLNRHVPEIAAPLATCC